MLKLSSLQKAFIIFVYTLLFTFSTYSNDRSVNKNNKTKSSSAPIIVINNNPNENDQSILMTNDSYEKDSGFSKDYTILDKQMVMQSSIVKNRDNAVGKVYIPKSFEEASRLAELKHGVSKRRSNLSKHTFDKKTVMPVVAEKKGVSFLASVVYHSNGKSDLNSEDLKALEEVAKFVKNKSADVLIVGHASSRTADMSMIDHKFVNHNISIDRAERVKKELVKNGVPLNSISMSAVSDTEPLKNEVMPKSEGINRRSEIYISY